MMGVVETPAHRSFTSFTLEPHASGTFGRNDGLYGSIGCGTVRNRVPCRFGRRPAVCGVVHRGRHRDRMVAAQGLELRRQSVRCFVGHRSDHSQRMVSRYALLRRQITKRWPLLLVVSRALAPVKKIEHMHTIRDRVVIAQNAGVVAVMQRSSGIQAAHGIVPRPHAVCAAHPRSSVNARARSTA